MDSTKTIVLRRPLSYGKEADRKTVSEITVREPTAGEYETAEKTAGVFGMSITLIALLSGVPVDVIDDMYRSQIDEAEDFIGSFGVAAMQPTKRSDDEMVLPLQRPVKLTEDATALNISSLALREPTNRQRRKASEAGGAFATGVALISAVAGVPKSSVRALCSRDFLSACGYFNGFQIRRQTTSDD